VDLVADIGATNTRCALIDDKGRELTPERFRNASYGGVFDILREYLDHRRESDQPQRAALCIAAPILGDEVHMTNLNWRFSQAELRRELDLRRLIVTNDFAALAWGLPHFGPADLRKIGGGTGPSRATLAAVGPGSGLGVSALVPSSDGWAVVTGEGGHVSLPAVTHEEEEVVALIRERYGHCSAERVLSGPGLVNLYQALATLIGRGQPTISAADVSELARQGEPLARKTLNMFFSMLGTVAADVALTVGARGGVYVAGGIAPKLVDSLAESNFRARFESKGRYRDYLATIPTYVITAALPAFRGLRYLLGYR